MYIQVNVLAILVCSLVNLAIGIVWYSPWLLGRRWSRLAHTRIESPLSRDQIVLYIGSYFAGLVLAAILALVISVSGVLTIGDGVILGAVVWIGFTAAPSFASTIFEGKSFELWGINVAYPLASTLVMSVILMVWR